MSARRELVALGVPRGQAAALAAFAGLESFADVEEFLADLDGMHFGYAMGVPEALRASFIELHNEWCLPGNEWAPPAGLAWRDVDWPAFELSLGSSIMAAFGLQ